VFSFNFAWNTCLIFGTSGSSGSGIDSQHHQYLGFNKGSLMFQVMQFGNDFLIVGFLLLGLNKEKG